MDSRSSTLGEHTSLSLTASAPAPLWHRPPADVCHTPSTELVLLTHVSHSHIWEAIRLVWPDSHWADDSNFRGIEPRL
jgi:hypothetical protein